MKPKATTCEEAAVECAAALSTDDIEYFRLHIGYTHHHFEYGLYLRNRYSYLLDEKKCGTFDETDPDNLGKNIYHLMIPILFPEFKGYEQYLDRITNMPFDELNANYNLKFGKNFIVDITPEQFFSLPEDPPLNKDDFDKWKKLYIKENNEYSVSIAERIWEYGAFKVTASQLGYSDSEIEETHRLCIDLLENKWLFVPLEVLFAKKDATASISAMMRHSKIIERFFSKHNESEVRLLPTYVFKNREVVKIMVSANGSLLELAEDYQSDREIVLTAVKSSTCAARFIDKSLWGDREIAIEAARNSDCDLVFSYDAFKQYNDDNEIVLLALEANGANICDASERIRADYDMAVFALTHQREIYPVSVYGSLSEELRGRKDLALLELQAPVPSLDGFTDELLDDDDIAVKLIENEKITWLFYEMSDRINQKYLGKLPKR